MRETTMKKSISFLIVIAAIALFAVCIGVTEATEPEPDMSIKACNLSFQDNVYIKYAVKSSSLSGIKLLIWTSPQSDYVYGTQNSVLSSIGTEVINGDNCAVFQYKELAAKQMTDVIYARAFVEKSGIKYYSDIKKYSILQYVYNKTGKTGTASTNQKLLDLLNGMIEYGSLAQIYCDYNSDRLANDDWFQVTIEGGYLSDFCSQGLYLPGDIVTLIAPETDELGQPFFCWIDSNGIVVGTNCVETITVQPWNEKYTSIYGVYDPEEQGHNLEFTLSDDSTYYSVSGIGSFIGTSVVIPDEHCGLPIKEIGSGAFNNCSHLISVTMGDNITKLGSMAFGCCSSLSNITLPESLQSIDYRAFYGCSSLICINIPESVTIIGTHIFENCSNLSTVYYNSSYSNINNHFLNLPSIKTVIFGGPEIPDFAAEYIGFQSSIETVEITGKVEWIGKYAFADCTSLTSVIISSGKKYISEYAFYRCSSLGTISVPYGVETIKTATFFGCHALTSVFLPNSITSIEEWAFCNCVSLEYLALPNAVISIGADAFNDCKSLKRIAIPNSVESIGSSAFYGCVVLEDFSVPNNLQTLGAAAFYECKALDSIALPEALTCIKNKTFYKCRSLTKINIPKSVTTIGEYALYYCDSLTIINYEGTMSEWADIDFSSTWNLSTGNYSIYCIDGVIPK